MEVRKSFRIEPRKSKPLMLLKDYLLDDLSSCSSGGFRSFPRRPRRPSNFASIRLLLDVDLRTGIPAPAAVAAKTNKKRSLNRSSSSARFRAAAVKVVNAVKSPLLTTCFLPHGGRATRKLLMSEAGDAVGREFTTETSSFGGEDGVVSELKDAAVGAREEKVSGTDGRDCIGGEAADPCSKERLKDKEQFSPVSVLDCPFDEEDDYENDTRSDCSPTNLPTKRGSRRHGGISRLAPVQLEEQIASLELEEVAARLEGWISSPSRTTRCVGEESQEEKDETESTLERMLVTVKADVPSYDSRDDVLLLDFLREKTEERGGNRRTDRFEHEAVRTAEEWARGEVAREAYSRWWEMEGGRVAYVKDMERGNVRWDEMGNFEGCDSERYEVFLEVEDDVWTLLVYEVLINIFG